MRLVALSDRTHPSNHSLINFTPADAWEKMLLESFSIKLLKCYTCTAACLQEFGKNIERDIAFR